MSSSTRITAVHKRCVPLPWCAEIQCILPVGQPGTLPPLRENRQSRPALRPHWNVPPSAGNPPRDSGPAGSATSHCRFTVSLRLLLAPPMHSSTQTASLAGLARSTIPEMRHLADCDKGPRRPAAASEHAARSLFRLRTRKVLDSENMALYICPRLPGTYTESWKWPGESGLC